MTWIYFCLLDGERIKIGETSDLRARMRTYERGTIDRHKVDLLAAIEGSTADEGHVQRWFAEDSIDDYKPENGNPTEVFTPSEELTNYIRWLRNQWYTLISVDDEPPDGRTTFDVWGPSPGREVPPRSRPLFPPDFLDFTDRVVTGDDYYTNKNVLELARIALGAIDLDPASHPLANKHVKATQFYSFQDNGLEQIWYGRVWLNPPFSQWKQWVPKILEEWKSGRVESMCVYCAMRTITAQYFRRLLDIVVAKCVITGRLKHGGKGGDSPDDGHCVFYLGPHVDKFCDTFKKIGVIWVKPGG